MKNNFLILYEFADFNTNHCFEENFKICDEKDVEKLIKDLKSCYNIRNVRKFEIKEENILKR